MKGIFTKFDPPIVSVIAAIVACYLTTITTGRFALTFAALTGALFVQGIYLFALIELNDRTNSYLSLIADLKINKEGSNDIETTLEPLPNNVIQFPGKKDD